MIRADWTGFGTPCALAPEKVQPVQGIVPLPPRTPGIGRDGVSSARRGARPESGRPKAKAAPEKKCEGPKHPSQPGLEAAIGAAHELGEFPGVSRSGKAIERDRPLRGKFKKDVVAEEPLVEVDIVPLDLIRPEHARVGMHVPLVQIDIVIPDVASALLELEEHVPVDRAAPGIDAPDENGGAPPENHAEKMMHAPEQLGGVRSRAARVHFRRRSDSEFSASLSGPIPDFSPALQDVDLGPRQDQLDRLVQSRGIDIVVVGQGLDQLPLAAEESLVEGVALALARSR